MKVKVKDKPRFKLRVKLRVKASTKRNRRRELTGRRVAGPQATRKPALAVRLYCFYENFFLKVSWRECPERLSLSCRGRWQAGSLLFKLRRLLSTYANHLNGFLRDVLMSSRSFRAHSGDGVYNFHAFNDLTEDRVAKAA